MDPPTLYPSDIAFIAPEETYLDNNNLSLRFHIIVSDTTSPTYRLHKDEEKWYLCSLPLDSFKLS